jgi:hypothetical protein
MPGRAHVTSVRTYTIQFSRTEPRLQDPKVRSVLVCSASEAAPCGTLLRLRGRKPTLPPRYSQPLFSSSSSARTACRSVEWERQLSALSPVSRLPKPSSRRSGVLLRRFVKRKRMRFFFPGFSSATQSLDRAFRFVAARRRRLFGRARFLRLEVRTVNAHFCASRTNSDLLEFIRVYPRAVTRPERRPARFEPASVPVAGVGAQRRAW